MTKNELLEKLKEIGVVERKSTVLRSGVASDLYFDVRKVFGHPEILNAVADEIGKLIPKNVTCIAASGYGGLPIAAVVASRFNLKLVGVRDVPKDHGKSSLIAGYMPSEGDFAVIVDDVLTTGSSIQTTIAGLATTKAKVECAIVVVKRGEPDLPISHSAIFKAEDLVDE